MGPRNRRSLRYATPDFLSMLVALANLMRLSLRKAAHANVSSAAWQEIRVRSGRDDKGEVGCIPLDLGHPKGAQQIPRCARNDK
jgi:hypothetical protein